MVPVAIHAGARIAPPWCELCELPRCLRPAGTPDLASPGPTRLGSHIGPEMAPLSTTLVTLNPRAWPRPAAWRESPNHGGYFPNRSVAPGTFPIGNRANWRF